MNEYKQWWDQLWENRIFEKGEVTFISAFNNPRATTYIAALGK